MVPLYRLSDENGNYGKPAAKRKKNNSFSEINSPNG